MPGKLYPNSGRTSSGFSCDQIFAIHSRYTVFGSYRFLQGLGERSGPCKYYVSFYAVFFSFFHGGGSQFESAGKFASAKSVN
jgi:hypothetical protein